MSDFMQRGAVVTGANRGIGKAIALAFLRGGWPVVAVARTADSLESLRGKAIGISDQASPAKNFSAIFLAKNGIDPVRLVPIVHYDGTPITARYIAGAIGDHQDQLQVTPLRKVKS